MNIYLLIAGILCILLGLVHSVLGERLIFIQKRRKGNLVPTEVKAGLREQHLRIIWATWHLVTVFGFVFGFMLLKMTFTSGDLYADCTDIILRPTMYTMFVGALLVLVATKGKHPGWIVLLVIGALLILSIQ